MPATLANAWRKLHGNSTDVHRYFVGFDSDDFHEHFERGGDRVAQEDIKEWLQEDEGDPGHQLLSMDEIVEEIQLPPVEEEHDPEEEEQVPKQKLSAVRAACDVPVEHMDSVYNPMLFT